MRRDGDGFNLDDMMRILGDSAPGAARPLPVEAPPHPARGAASAPPPAPAAVANGAVGDAELTPEEQALLRDYEEGRRRRLLEEKAERVREQLAVREREARRIIEEYERQAAAAAPAPAQGAGGDLGADENAALCALLEGSRVVMFSYLAPRIGSKNAVSMLAKSVEKARAKAPALLKDVNWRVDGSLREDGSVDAERLFKNVAALPVETREAEYLACLREIVDLRLRAVEAGLGAPVRKELAERLLATRGDPANRKVPAAWLAAFYERVLA